jgi:hypothetical protein
MSRIIQDNQDYLSVIGHVKCGIKIKRNGKEYPSSLDHFIATGDYANKFKTAFPEKTNCIEIVFLDDYEAYSCNQRFELRKGKNWYAKGDGKKFEVYNEKTGNFDKIIKETKEQGQIFMSEIEKLTGEKFEAKLTIRFAIMKIRDILGVWELNTGGEKTSVNGVVNAYDLVKKNAGGRVKGFTFDLRVKKVVSDKYNTKRSYPIIELIPHASTEHLDLVRNCIEQNVKLPLMLEPEKIDNIQLDPTGNSILYVIPDEKSKDDFAKNNIDPGSNCTDAEIVEDVPVEPEPGKTTQGGNMVKVKIFLDTVFSPVDMIQASKEIEALELSPEEKAIANKMKNDKLKSIRGKQ